MTDEGEFSPNRRPGKSEAAFRTISEVSDELNVSQHVLRFWESKFPQVKPMKRGGGRRYYRPEDVTLLGRIRDLLYAEGYTIKGVQKLLREGGHKRSLPVLDEPKTVVQPALPTLGIIERPQAAATSAFENLAPNKPDLVAEPVTEALGVDDIDEDDDVLVLDEIVQDEEQVLDENEMQAAEQDFSVSDAWQGMPLTFASDVETPAASVAEVAPVLVQEQQVNHPNRAELRAILAELETLRSLLQPR